MICSCEIGQSLTCRTNSPAGCDSAFEALLNILLIGRLGNIAQSSGSSQVRMTYESLPLLAKAGVLGNAGDCFQEVDQNRRMRRAGLADLVQRRIQDASIGGGLPVDPNPTRTIA
jgi:hypothetical protein